MPGKNREQEAKQQPQRTAGIKGWRQQERTEPVRTRISSVKQRESYENNGKQRKRHEKHGKMEADSLFLRTFSQSFSVKEPILAPIAHCWLTHGLASGHTALPSEESVYFVRVRPRNATGGSSVRF